MVCVKFLALTYLSCLAVQAIFKLLGPTISTQVISLILLEWFSHFGCHW